MIFNISCIHILFVKYYDFFFHLLTDVLLNDYLLIYLHLLISLPFYSLLFCVGVWLFIHSIIHLLIFLLIYQKNPSCLD